MIRDDIKAAQIAAMKAGDKARARRRPPDPRQDQGPRHRAAHRAAKPIDDDALVIEVLQKMVKQRRESIELYEKGGRQELADVEARRARGDRGVPAPRR